MQKRTITFTGSQEEINLIKKLWSRKVLPKFIFIDNCVVTDINNNVHNDPNEKDPLKLDVFNYLRMNDIENNNISLLLVILEKLLNTDTESSQEEIISSIINYDMPNVLSFFKNAKLYEPEKAVYDFINHIDGFKKVDSLYKNFLLDVNRELKLYNKISDKPENSKKRIATVHHLLDIAKKYDISPDDPITLTCISHIYRLPEAQAVLKFSNNVTNFSTSNALSDILVLTRINFINGLLKQANLDRFEIIFKTSDRGLHNLNQKFNFIKFNTIDKENYTFSHTFEFHYKHLLYCICNEKGEILTECKKEACEIYKNLGINLSDYID